MFKLLAYLLFIKKEEGNNALFPQNMKKKYSLFNTVSHIFFLCCLIITALFLLYIYVHSKYTRIALNDHAVYSLDTGWQYTYSPSTITASASSATPPTSPYALTLKRPLTEASPHANYLLLRSFQQSLDVWVDQQLIYSYHIASPTNFENHTANAWHFIALPYNYNYAVAHTLTLKLSSSFPSNVTILSNIYLGSQIGCLYKLFQTYALAWITSLLLLLLAFVLLAYSLFSFLKKRPHTQLFYLGLFTMCVSICSASEGQLLQFIISNRQFEYYLNYCLLFLLPIPFLFYIKLSYTAHTPWVYDLLIWLFGINFMTCMTLVIFNISDFIQLIFALQLLIITTLIICSMSFFPFIKFQTKHKHFIIQECKKLS